MKSNKNEFRTAIVLKSGKLVSMNGSIEEVEMFVLENLDNMKQSRTINRSTGKRDDDLTIKN